VRDRQTDKTVYLLLHLVEFTCGKNYKNLRKLRTIKTGYFCF